jgi:hypothetical protein
MTDEELEAETTEAARISLAVFERRPEGAVWGSLWGSLTTKRAVFSVLKRKPRCTKKEPKAPD